MRSPATNARLSSSGSREAPRCALRSATLWDSGFGKNTEATSSPPKPPVESGESPSDEMARLLWESESREGRDSRLHTTTAAARSRLRPKEFA